MGVSGDEKKGILFELFGNLGMMPFSLVVTVFTIIFLPYLKITVKNETSGVKLVVYRYI